ncbi:MAG: sugar isomerase domain-containing protein [Anaerolineales bacterium]|nr:sugar isomerase domain-containing protein [Anaerolineales bacterium]
MSAEIYFSKIEELIKKVHTTQLDAIQQAGTAMAGSIAAGRAVHIFGSGHSVIPVMDIFPRYGGFIGFHPIYDPRLMWSNVVGPGGARELLWLERQENYIEVMLESHYLDERDTMLVFSHGGLNAAPVEMALGAKRRGLTVVAVTSLANHEMNTPTHSSGESLKTAADIVIDNCSPPEDALVPVGDLPGKTGASSTVTAVTIAMALVSETASRLTEMGKTPERLFVSPNVKEVPATNTADVYRDYMVFEKSL